MQIESTVSEGKATLTMTQGDIKNTIDIAGEYKESIDIGDFESGPINLRLEFENAKEVDVTITW